MSRPAELHRQRGESARHPPRDRVHSIGARDPTPPCPGCGSADPLRCDLPHAGTGGCVVVAERTGRVATREQVVTWMRESRGSAADFFDAAATFFAIEEHELVEEDDAEAEP